MGDATSCAWMIFHVSCGHASELESISLHYFLIESAVYFVMVTFQNKLAFCFCNSFMHGTTTVISMNRCPLKK